MASAFLQLDPHLDINDKIDNCYNNSLPFASMDGCVLMQ